MKINSSDIITEPVQTHTSQILDVDVEIINPKRKTNQSRTNLSNQVNDNIQNNGVGANIVNADETEQNIEEIQLKYGASHVIKLFLPVTLCILFVIISLTLITSYQKSGGANL